MTGAPSLVRRLQDQISRTDIPVSVSLRTAKLLAAEAKATEALTWIDNEISGYTDMKPRELPSYRQLRGKVRARRIDGSWTEVTFLTAVHEETVATLPLAQSVAVIESYAKGCVGELSASLSYPVHLQERLRNMFRGCDEFVLEVPAAVFDNALEGVRNKLLSWTIDLAEAGILGENMTLTPDEKREATHVMNNHFHNSSNIQVVGSVSANSTVSQHNATELNLAAVADVLRQIQSAQTQLPTGVRKTAVETAEQIHSALAQPDPKPSDIRRLLISLRTILEGATGNLVATGAVALLKPFTS